MTDRTHGRFLLVELKDRDAGYVERFWSKVDKSGVCWKWLGYSDRHGYGGFRFPGIGKLAHRIAYTLSIGPIPDGLTLDHLCRNRGCVRPDHLEPVTLAENKRRGESPSARHSRQTHCKRGHALTPENIYRQPSQPNSRTCRACRKLAWGKPKTERGCEQCGRIIRTFRPNFVRYCSHRCRQRTYYWAAKKATA